MARDAYNGRLLWKRELGAYGWREWAKDWWAGMDWTTVRAGRTKVPEGVSDSTVAQRTAMSALDTFNEYPST